MWKGNLSNAVYSSWRVSPMSCVQGNFYIRNSWMEGRLAKYHISIYYYYLTCLLLWQDLRLRPCTWEVAPSQAPGNPWTLSKNKRKDLKWTLSPSHSLRFLSYNNPFVPWYYDEFMYCKHSGVGKYKRKKVRS